MFLLALLASEPTSQCAPFTSRHTTASMCGALVKKVLEARGTNNYLPTITQ